MTEEQYRNRTTDVITKPTEEKKINRVPMFDDLSDEAKLELFREAIHCAHASVQIALSSLQIPLAYVVMPGTPYSTVFLPIYLLSVPPEKRSLQDAVIASKLLPFTLEIIKHLRENKPTDLDIMFEISQRAKKAFSEISKNDLGINLDDLTGDKDES